MILIRLLQSQGNVVANPSPWFRNVGTSVVLGL